MNCKTTRGAATVATCLAFAAIACEGRQPGATQPPGVAAPVQSAPALRRIVISARQFEFEPSRIEMVEGEEVLLELRALDRTHGFAIFELGISVQILPGRPTLLRLKPPRAGTFTYACSVECGSGHELMNGTLVVKPKR